MKCGICTSKIPINADIMCAHGILFHESFIVCKKCGEYINRKNNFLMLSILASIFLIWYIGYEYIFYIGYIVVPIFIK